MTFWKIERGSFLDCIFVSSFLGEVTELEAVVDATFESRIFIFGVVVGVLEPFLSGVLLTVVPDAVLPVNTEFVVVPNTSLSSSFKINSELIIEGLTLLTALRITWSLADAVKDRE